MNKISMIFCVIIQSIMMVAMDSSAENIAQIEKMEIFRRIRRQERKTVEMSIESNSQTEDDMSCSGSLNCSQSSSGSFPIFIPTEVVLKKNNNLIVSKQGRTPRQRESSKKFLQNLGVEK